MTKTTAAILTLELSEIMKLTSKMNLPTPNTILIINHKAKLLKRKFQNRLSTAKIYFQLTQNCAHTLRRDTAKFLVEPS